jgi:glycosyltransferase involved in cell wall biosynthesis
MNYVQRFKSNGLFFILMLSKKTLKQKNKKKVSILIPAKDEEETLGMLLADINSVIKENNDYAWELIVIADHCVDKTEEIAKNYGAVILNNLKSSGKGNALRLGFEKATGDIIIMLDADYSHRAEHIPYFLKYIKDEHVGLVIGSRCLGGSDEFNLVRSLGNIILTGAVNLLFHIKLTDALNGYKAFRRSIIQNYNFSSSTFEIEIELIYASLFQNMQIVEFPSHERARAGGEMKSQALIHGPKFLFCILKKGIQYNFRKCL